MDFEEDKNPEEEEADFDGTLPDVEDDVDEVLGEEIPAEDDATPEEDEEEEHLGSDGNY